MDSLPTELSGKSRTLCTLGYIYVTKSTSHVTDSIRDAYCDGFSAVSSSRHLNGFSIQIDGLVKILGNIMRTKLQTSVQIILVDNFIFPSTLQKKFLWEIFLFEFHNIY